MEKEMTENEPINNSENTGYSHRSLNRELFEAQQFVSRKSDNQASLSPQQRFKPLLDHLDFKEKPPVSAMIPKDPAVEQVKEIKRQFDNMQIQMTEFIKATQFKVDQLVKTVKVLEQGVSHQKQEGARQYAELSGRLTERKVTENKVSDLIDRHNQIVNDFENRLSQLRRSLNERELKFLQMASAVEEAQREIERLKRL